MADYIIHTKKMSKEMTEYFENLIGAKNGPIVHCSECKYFHMFDGKFPICGKWSNGSATDPDGYCYLAERRDSDDEWP